VGTLGIASVIDGIVGSQLNTGLSDTFLHVLHCVCIVCVWCSRCHQSQAACSDGQKRFSVTSTVHGQCLRLLPMFLQSSVCVFERTPQCFDLFPRVCRYMCVCMYVCVTNLNVKYVMYSIKWLIYFVPTVKCFVA